VLEPGGLLKGEGPFGCRASVVGEHPRFLLATTYRQPEVMVSPP
jgi:hypothetical protein